VRHKDPAPRPEVCGCIARGAEWLRLCPAHKREFDATHQRWAAERRLGVSLPADVDPQEFLDLL
jgi:hypothetical protein